MQHLFSWYLLIIESSDLIFAVDSIPAILAISHDRFIVYTSNIFAIMGLRSLYFAIAGIMGFFRYLKVGLAFVLTFVGLKMLAAYFNFEIPIVLSLIIIISILIISILSSVFIKEENRGNINQHRAIYQMKMDSNRQIPPTQWPLIDSLHY